MIVLITGADGFIARNLRRHLHESGEFEFRCFTRDTPVEQLSELVVGVDAVVHLAGVNRPQRIEDFQRTNADLTAQLCNALRSAGGRAAVLFASSTQAAQDNPYGRSKAEAEGHLAAYGAATGATVVSYRLPNVFGKWSRPNYNSVVATFCHNIARGLPIDVHDPESPIALVYVDDVVDEFAFALRALRASHDLDQRQVAPEYKTTVGQLAAQIHLFHDSRRSLLTERVGSGLIRALYATYVSFLPTTSFNYLVPKHSDPRGVFVEMLKTPDAGQFSFFTAHPGVTRGGHYHHSKTEKFLVLRGQARFRFRHIETNERHELFTSGETPEVVESVPGWTHNIANVGADEMLVLLWANEIFDRQRPDTIPSEVWS